MICIGVTRVDVEVLNVDFRLVYTVLSKRILSRVASLGTSIKNTTAQSEQERVRLVIPDFSAGFTGTVL